MDIKGAVHAVEALHAAMTPDEQELFTSELQARFGLVAEAAGHVAVTETTAQGLTPEQTAKAEKYTIAMAEHFGVDKSEFSVVTTTGEDGKDIHTLMHTAPNGIHKGSWNKVMGKQSDKDFTVEIDGQTVDTRKGMTHAAYSAFIADAKAKGINPLPDSSQLAEQNGQPWTWTLLTGEQARDSGAPFACVVVGGVGRYWGGRDFGVQDVRVRPAVVI